MIKCFVCMDKGYDIIRQKKTVTARNGEKQELYYDYALHCDRCNAGDRQRVHARNKNGDIVYSEPMSKYYNLFELEKNNKEKYEKQLKNDKQSNFRIDYSYLVKNMRMN